MQILVFKTNLSNSRHIKKIAARLNQHPGIEEWNVDLHDCDKILRIVTAGTRAPEIEHIVSSAGHSCIELVD